MRRPGYLAESLVYLWLATSGCSREQTPKIEYTRPLRTPLEDVGPSNLPLQRYGREYEAIEKNKSNLARMMLDPNTPEGAAMHAHILFGDCIQVQSDLRKLERMENQLPYFRTKPKNKD